MSTSSDPLRLMVTVEDVPLLIRLADKYNIRNYDLIAQLYEQIGKVILEQYAEGIVIALRDPKTRRRGIFDIDQLISAIQLEDIMHPVKDK